MISFEVGQQVVCVDDRFRNVSIDQQIRKGRIYTVRWAGNFSHYIDGDFYGIKLMEIDRGNDDGPEGYGYADMPFRASRFRPLVRDRVRALLGLKAPTPKNVTPPGDGDVPAPPAPKAPPRKAPVREREDA